MEGGSATFATLLRPFRLFEARDSVPDLKLFRIMDSNSDEFRLIPLIFSPFLYPPSSGKNGPKSEDPGRLKPGRSTRMMASESVSHCRSHPGWDG